MYVDSYLLTELPQGGRLAHAAIVGPGSGVWASDPAFPAVSQAEAMKLAALLESAAAATSVAAVGAAAGVTTGGGASGVTKKQQVSDISIGGKAYEARVTTTAASGAAGGGAGASVQLLMCRSKGGVLGLGGGKEGAVIAATGQALVIGLWTDRRVEQGCSNAVERLAQALISYGY